MPPPTRATPVSGVRQVREPGPNGRGTAWDGPNTMDSGGVPEPRICATPPGPVALEARSSRGASGDDPGLPSVTPCGVGMAGASRCCKAADPVADWALTVPWRAHESLRTPPTRGWHGILSPQVRRTPAGLGNEGGSSGGLTMPCWRCRAMGPTSQSAGRPSLRARPTIGTIAATGCKLPYRDRPARYLRPRPRRVPQPAPRLQGAPVALRHGRGPNQRDRVREQGRGVGPPVLHEVRPRQRSL